MNVSGKKILVIGGAGFIGSHVVAQLLQEDVKQVIVYDNFSRGKMENIKDSLMDPRCIIFPDGGDVREKDLLDKAVSQSDAVFHLAAMWLLHCRDYPRTAFEVNIEGTFNVLEACAKHGIEKLIYSSSASVYGDAVAIPMTEDHPLNNTNFYGATKISGEAMAKAYFDRFGLDYIALRYMNVYGAKQDQKAVYTGVITSVLNCIENNTVPTINGDGSQSYDFISVEDVAKANICALKSDATDLALNISTGKQTSISELCRIIFELCGIESNVTYSPYSEEDTRRLVQNRVGSTAKAKQYINFESEITLEEGIKSLIKWRNSLGKNV